MLGRTGGRQGREEEGDMSHPLTQQSGAWSDKISGRSEYHKQNCDSAGGGESLKLCVLGRGAPVANSLAKTKSLY